MNKEKLEIKLTITKNSTLVDVDWTGKITKERRDVIDKVQKELYSTFFKNKKRQ